jgi:anti-sigma B factor antagonist
MSASIGWSERRVGGVVVIALQRGLKGGVESALKDHIETLVRQGYRQILIDLEQLPYVDSTELGRLIRSHIAVRQAGGRVRLCNLSDRMRHLMEITRLDTVLELYGSMEEALAAIRSSQGSGTAGEGVGTG